MAKRPVRFFNTTGPCNPDDHYMLPPADRLVGAQLHRYIHDQLYWVLHAPRQTGKTTFLLNWMREINAGTEAVACYVSVERCQGILEPERSMPAICSAIRQSAATFGVPVPDLPDVDSTSLLSSILCNWAALVAPKPLIVLFDEVDVLEGETLISFLRQLRDGFAGRGAGTFPTSIALVGMRDLKDYITKSKGGVAPNPGSPFNVKSDSAAIGYFSKGDVTRLFAQRTAENGQQITQEALDYVFDQSRGQPWIVNSLFQRATMRVLDRDSTETVTFAHIREARQQMVKARETHFDSLATRLDDPRVRALIETLLVGNFDPQLTSSDTYRVCLDLGLVAMENGTVTIANPMYREEIDRYFTESTQYQLPQRDEWKWQRPDGRLDMDSLLREFQGFWQENSAAWDKAFNYTEAFPHLLLMAFLQRVTNGDGRIEREYAAGRGRTDLAIEYKGGWNIIELKLLRENQTYENLKTSGVRQVLAYRDSFSPALRGLERCYLIIFDRRPEAARLPWSEKIKWEHAGEDVTVLGC